MAKNVTIAGAAYSAVPSIDVPQTGGGVASFYDVSGTTATASDVAQGKVFYAADGTETTGTASGGGGGLEYEGGTFILPSDTTRATIPFSKTYTEPPVFALVSYVGTKMEADLASTYIAQWVFFSQGALTGQYFQRASSGGTIYGASFIQYFTSSTGIAATSLTANGVPRYGWDDSGDSSNLYLRFFVEEDCLHPGHASRPLRGGVEYQWIAAWA